MGIWEYLPQETVGPLLGKFSLNSKGVTVIPGIIDCDYLGEIQVLTICQGLPISPPG